MTDANSTSCSVMINNLSSEQTPKSIVYDQPPSYELSLNNKDKICDKVQSQSQSGSRNNAESPQALITMQLNATHSIDEIPSYQCLSVFNTLCCCLCFGLMACLYSSRTKLLKKQSNFQDALKTSRKARNWNIIALVTGITILILYTVSEYLVLVQKTT